MKTNSFYYTAILMFFLLTGFLGANAQTLEEYKKQRQQEMQQYKEDRQKQMQRLADEYTDYVNKRDKEFSDYLEQRWKEFQLFQGLEVPADPKPVVVPEFKPSDRTTPPKGLPTLKPSIEPMKDQVPAPILPRITKKEPEKFPVNTAEVDFYGFPMVFDYDKKLSAPFTAQIAEEAISNHWQRLSEANYNHLVQQLLGYKEISNLNDWGYYQLVKKVASKITSGNENSQKLLTWFILIRSGYKTKIAYFENDVYVLLPANNQIYGVNFFTFDNLRYYIMDGKLSNIFTYEKDFPDAQKTFDLNIYSPIFLGDKPANRDFKYSYQGVEMPISISYSNDLIDFYKDYPLADIKIYFDAAVSGEAKESLANSFKPLIEGKSELQAVNLLLNFVQTAFEYKTDNDQFGYEKFFFAEEAFYYPYCDCEDRSVLFAYLVKHLVGLEVVGLDYPGHMATAVRFTQPVDGDYVTYDGDKYIVSDPTYINAPVGLTMPQYLQTQATVVILNSFYPKGISETKIWEEVIAAGGNRGDNRRDIIVDDNGNSILSGYFTESFKMGNVNLQGTGKPSMFTISLDKNLKPSWFASGTGDGKSLAYGLAKDKTGVYVTGTFEGELSLSGKALKSDKVSDVFLAKFSTDGKLQWLEKAGIDTINQENFLNFVARFDARGKHLATDLYFETADFNNYGISLSPDGEVLVAGAFNKTTGMNVNKLSPNEITAFNSITSLKEENDKLISQQYEKSIAGLFAVINLVKNSGVSIPGTDAQTTLDKYNPSFKQKSPDIYKNIGRITFIKNSDGIVTVKTSDGKDVYFDMMRVRNDTKVKLSFLASGDARLEILSGVRVGKSVVWFDLNYVEMYKKTGDMLFDYDSDHTQKKLNLKNDILY